MILLSLFAGFAWLSKAVVGMSVADSDPMPTFFRKFLREFSIGKSAVDSTSAVDECNKF